jgi:chemotaxis protein MotB
MLKSHFRTELLSEETADDSSHHERWILSYADFITLMFAFFVVMYSISSVNDGKFWVLSKTMLDVFQNPAAVAQVEQRLLAQAAEVAQRQYADIGAEETYVVPSDFDATSLRAEQVAEVVSALLAKPIAQADVHVRNSADWTEIELAGDFAFAPDSMELEPPALAALAAIADLARVLDVPVRVEGFTDNVPVVGGVYASKRELSAAAAARVAEALVGAGLRGERVSASGFGELHPIASNATSAGRQRNQRVVIAVARHSAVAPLSASLAANDGQREQLPQRSLQRVTELPGPELITL